MKRNTQITTPKPNHHKTRTVKFWREEARDRGFFRMDTIKTKKKILPKKKIDSQEHRKNTITVEYQQRNAYYTGTAAKGYDNWEAHNIQIRLHITYPENDVRNYVYINTETHSKPVRTEWLEHIEPRNPRLYIWPDNPQTAPSSPEKTPQPQQLHATKSCWDEPN